MKFDELVEYLGEELHVSLIPDKEQTLSIQVDDHLTIQLEMDDWYKRFFVLAFVHELPPGRFRENVFISALKANYFPIRAGTLGFYKEESYLTFHRFIPNDTPKKDIINFLTEVIYIAEKWKKALDSGKAAPDDISTSSEPSTLNPFGLKP